MWKKKEYIVCDAIYVGKTERNLKIRMSEHLSDFKNQKKGELIS